MAPPERAHAATVLAAAHARTVPPLAPPTVHAIPPLVHGGAQSEGVVTAHTPAPPTLMCGAPWLEGVEPLNQITHESHDTPQTTLPPAPTVGPAVPARTECQDPRCPTLPPVPSVVEVLEHRGDMQKDAPPQTEEQDSQDPPSPKPAKVPLVARATEYMDSDSMREATANQTREYAEAETIKLNERSESRENSNTSMQHDDSNERQDRQEQPSAGLSTPPTQLVKVELSAEIEQLKEQVNSLKSTSGASGRRSDGPLTLIDLCSGCGGIVLAARRLGMAVQAAFDNNPRCIDTLVRNGVKNAICSDLRTIDYARFKGVDVISGGLPCQPWSIGGKSGGPNDNRDLWYQAIRAVREVRPKGFLFETVPGFLRSKWDFARADVFDKLNALGYTVECLRVNTVDYQLANRAKGALS